MKRSSIFIVLTAVLASLMEIIDTSIVGVAQPRMQGNLGVTMDEISWVSTGYIISNAIVLPIASWLGVRIGRRTYFLTCIILFTVVSALCGMAPNFGFLVFARIIQGAAGGALLPTSQTIIQEQFTGPRAGMGSAVYGMSVMVGPALGPTLGGYLTDNYSWRAIFYINVPIGILAALLAFLFIPAENPSEKKAEKGKVDWIGFALLAAWVGGLQYVLERGQQDDWLNSNLIFIAAVIVAICLPFFFVYELRHKKPIVDVKLFTVSAVRSGVALMAATGFVLYTLVFLIPIYTDRQMGMDATQTGLLYVPGSLATMVAMPFVGFMMGRIGPKPLILCGATFVSFCLFSLSNFTSHSGYPDLFWPLLVRGVGLGFLFVPINAAVLSQFKGEQLGQAAGLLNLFRQIGGSMGIAGVSTFLDRYSSQLRNDLRQPVGLGNPSAVYALSHHANVAGGAFPLSRGVGSGTLGFAARVTGQIGALKGRMEAQVFQLGFNRLMMLALIIYIIAMLPVFTMKLDKKVSGPVAAH